MFIEPAQKRGADASGDDMEETRLVIGNDMTAWIGHARILPSPAHWVYQNASCVSPSYPHVLPVSRLAPGKHG